MDREEVKTKLLEKLKCTKALPILFIGSGISRRYINTPNWDDLLKMLSDSLDEGPYNYEQYYSSASTQKNLFGINPKIATLLEQDFNKKWYKDDIFKKSRECNEVYIKQKCSPLKIEIAQYFREKSHSEYITEMMDEINLLKEVGNKSIGGVITTNYDTFIEDIFSGYKYDTFVGQEELIFSELTGIGEIYKIHGSCTEPNSIVITEKDYEKFNLQNAYLIAKLLTIFMEYPIIFLGYRLQDSNIQSILKSLTICLSEEKLAQLEDRFIFVEWNNSDKEDTITPYTSSIFEDGKSLNMTKVFVKDFSIIYEALMQNQASYNPRVLKKIKNDIYKLIITSKPSKSMNVTLDIDDSRLDEVETVVGIGVFSKLGIQGYGCFSAEDLYEDIIFDKKLKKELIVEKSLPIILKSNQSVPLFKYIKEYGKMLPSKVSNKVTSIKNISSFYSEKIKRDRKKPSKIIHLDIPAIEAKYGIDNALYKIVYIDYTFLKASDLFDFIKKYIDLHPKCLRGKSSQERAELRRLIKMYDYLEFR